MAGSSDETPHSSAPESLIVRTKYSGLHPTTRIRGSEWITRILSIASSPVARGDSQREHFVVAVLEAFVDDEARRHCLNGRTPAEYQFREVGAKVKHVVRMEVASPLDGRDQQVLDDVDP